MRRIGEHAVVIRASMGGLLAARALADYFGHVTVLERDVFPADGVARKGVPQGRHAHGLLARGRDVIEDFFPDWTAEVVGWAAPGAISPMTSTGYRAGFDRAHVRQRQQPAPDRAFQHRAGGKQPDQVARRPSSG